MSDAIRRTWNKQEYAKKAAQRATDTLPVQIEANDKIDFEQLVNTSIKVQAVDESGFHCRICGVNFKDNVNYLDHLNSPDHLLKAGQEIKVQRATIGQVRDRLNRKKTETKVLDPKERFQLRLKREEELKAKKKELKKLKKASNEQETEISKIMGFHGFKSTK